MGIPKSVEQAREYSNNINNVDPNAMPQNEQNLAIRYALHDIAKKTGEAPTFNFDYSPVDYDDTLSSEIYKPYVNPLQDAFGMLWNAVPSIGAAMLSFPTIMASGGISLLNDALERITGDDYDDPKVQAEKKNWFYDPAARGSIEWTNSVNDFFDSWKYKPSEKAQEKLDVTNFWATANPNNVAANIGNGIGSVIAFIGTIALTKGMSGGGSVKLFQGLSNISKAEVLGSYMYMNNEVYNEFRNNAKIDDLTAAKLSSLVSLPIALSEYVGLSALGKVMTKPMVKNAIKGGVEEAIASYGTKGLTKELYQDFTAKAIQGIGNRMTTAALKGAEGAVIEGVQEYGQGKMQQAAEALYDKIANEKVFGTELFNKQALKDDVNNAFWGGAIGGLLGMGGGMINSKEMQESVFHYVGINLQKNRPAKIDGVKKFITQLGENGKITPEQTEQGIQMVDEMVAVHKEAMPLSLTDIDARYQAYEFIQARNKIQADLLALDEKPVDPTLAKADSELRTIMEQSAEAYDEAIALIAKTKGQISESELSKKLYEIGTQFNKVEAPKEEVKTDITGIENKEELTTETKDGDKKADIERRREEELKNRVVYDRKPTVEDGEFKIVGDTTNRTFRVNENTGRPQVLDESNGLWSNTEESPNLFFEIVSRSGFEKSKGKINTKYDAELAALEKNKESNQEEAKVDLGKNEEMLKKAEKALKSTVTKIEQLKTQPLGAKESQAARDEKIANFEERKKQIETKIGELNAIREAETRVEGVEETGAVVETADTGVSAEEVIVATHYTGGTQNLEQLTNDLTTLYEQAKEVFKNVPKEDADNIIGKDLIDFAEKQRNKLIKETPKKVLEDKRSVEYKLNELYSNYIDVKKRTEEVKVNPDEVVAEVRVEPDVNTQSGIEEAQTDEIIPEQVQDDVVELKEPIEEKPTEFEEDKQGFTEAEVLNTIYSNLKQKYGDKKGSELYKVADRLVNPNKNTIVEIRGNGVVVKEGDSYLLKPFTNTDANSKKWQLGSPLDVTEQFVDKKSEEDKEPKRQESNIDETKDTGLVDGINNIRSNEGAFNLFKVALGRGVIHESWYNDIGLELADLKKDKKGKVDTADVAEIILKYSEREPKKKDDAKAREEQARINKEYETISEEIENIEDEKVEEVVNNKIENKKAPKRIYYKGIYTDGDGNFEFVEAENAKPIKLFSTVDAFYTKESGIFVITDTDSGAQIATGKTLKAAIKEAEKVAKSAENLIAVSRKYAEKHGFTPAMKIENAAKLEQDIKNASINNESVDGVVDNMEENGDIKKDCK